ncbi:tetratricopeptide repeat protein [Ramlibacter sp. G-1-2-2]|uniref:Tetratricopeptide repeat protein n=1 Tax=Ramlibacter agri TaxID=2728837 RepID=A0A848HA47_9BURK|nr:tetratricopeptide repeat-containing glycosyltransferase family protein [Ramlibacter agri]NML46311.1 tetratricopeptide repeat protein [Ramlibacter agri]
MSAEAGNLLAVLQREPDSLPVRLALARACRAAGDLLTATAWLSDAMRIAPQALEPVQELADLLLTQQRYVQAVPLYTRLLDEFGVRSAANLLHAGFCREHSGDVAAAAALYRATLEVEPALVEAHVDLSGVLWRLEDFDGALAHARRAVELAPAHPYAQRILGTALLHLERLDEAEQHLRRALELQPGFHLAELDLAFTLLLAGRLEEGWPFYERRWRDPARLPRPAFWQPGSEWPGPAQPLQGQAIGVYAEQGLGDVLQFVRYLPQLQALGAQVRCVVQPELVPLVEASFPGVECLKPGVSFNVHLHAALLELPGRFGTTLSSIPSAVPYLRAPEEARVRWRERLAPWAGQRKVGLAWSGSQVQVNNRNRAVPLSLLAPLLGQPGVQCFSLQKGEAGANTDLQPAPGELPDFTGDWADFADSAAMIEQLDLVVTVDTAIAHLVGALGKPVWILLPPNADWRWLVDRADSPWYPTARLFRRAAGEDRSAQIARLMRAFEAWLSS